MSWLEIGLSNALLATALALAARLVTRFYRHPKVVFAIWLLVLVRLVMPPVVGIAWQGWPADLLAMAASDKEPSLEGSSPLAATQRPSAPEPASATRACAADAAEPAVREAPAASVRRRAASARAFVPGASFVWGRPRLSTVIGAIWLAGSAGWLVVALVRIARFRRMLARATLAGGELPGQAAALAVAMKLRRVPVVRLVRAPVPPLVWALARRPTILLPAALWAKLSADERTTLLAHELAHLSRRDHLVRLLEMASLVLFWWHPVAWWARRHVERAGEECCDAAVVGRFPELVADYARALLATVDFLAERPAALPAGTSGFSQARQLKRRLEMILQGPVSRRVGWPGRLALAAVAIVVLPPFVHRVAAAPKPFVPKGGTIEERLDRLEKALQELTQELRAMRSEEAENAPPVVVKTEPADNATDVDPSLAEIKVTFSKDMHDGTWSWTQRSDDTFPEVVGKPHYIDKRTCVLPVKLQPGKTYHIGINSERFRNFKDEGRRPAVPYPLNFTTKQ